MSLPPWLWEDILGSYRYPDLFGERERERESVCVSVCERERSTLHVLACANCSTVVCSEFAVFTRFEERVTHNDLHIILPIDETQKGA